MATQPAGHPRAREDVMFRQVDDEWVVFDPAANQLHVLNLSAALVWSHCTGDFSPHEIARALEDAYGLEGERAQADVRAAIERFRGAGLLEAGG
jgi:PqqD family protein of HPr-rel-A system